MDGRSQTIKNIHLGLQAAHLTTTLGEESSQGTHVLHEGKRTPAQAWPSLAKGLGHTWASLTSEPRRLSEKWGVQDALVWSGFWEGWGF